MLNVTAGCCSRCHWLPGFNEVVVEATTSLVMQTQMRWDPSCSRERGAPDVRWSLVSNLEEAIHVLLHVREGLGSRRLLRSV
jgi:hypothetical protein